MAQLVQRMGQGDIALDVDTLVLQTDTLESLLSIPATGTQTSVDSVTTAGGVTILAANTSRRGATITNTDANALHLLFAANGTVTTGIYNVKLSTDGVLILNPGDYTGHISGIWAADGAGAAKVCEFT